MNRLGAVNAYSYFHFMLDEKIAPRLINERSVRLAARQEKERNQPEKAARVHWVKNSIEERTARHKVW